MIIFRYLSRQILQLMSAVTLILLLVALTSRFIQYLAQAVAGDFSLNVLFFLVMYRLPDFLMVILPLALLMGVLLVFGRMYSDNEMVVLLGSGYSEFRILLLTLGSTGFAMIFVAVLSLAVTPWGLRNIEQIKLDQSQLTEIDLIVPRQFRSFGQGRRIAYVERTLGRNDEVRRLENVFVAVNADSGDAVKNFPRILLADSARAEIDELTGARFMRLENGIEYDGVPGNSDFTIGQFDRQSILLPDSKDIELILKEQLMPTTELFGSTDGARIAELQWRLSMILMLPVITLIAVPLSRVSPRQGQYSKLVSATLIYAAYFVLLQFAKEQITESEFVLNLGLWWVHVIFIILGFVIFQCPAVGNYLALGGKR